MLENNCLETEDTQNRVKIVGLCQTNLSEFREGCMPLSGIPGIRISNPRVPTPTNTDTKLY